MFSTIIASAIVLLTAGQALAAPSPQATGVAIPACPLDYGPFKLFATRTSTGVTYPVRLLADQVTATNTTSHMIVDTASSCTNCGVAPAYWQLKNGRLFAVDASLTGTTVNQAVPQGSELDFITSSQAQLSYRIYCSQPSGSNMPPHLAVHGTSTLYTMCAFTSRIPPPTIFSIVFDQFNVKPVGESCYPVTLTMQSIGIVPT